MCLVTGGSHSNCICDRGGSCGCACTCICVCAYTFICNRICSCISGCICICSCAALNTLVLWGTVWCDTLLCNIALRFTVPHRTVFGLRCAVLYLIELCFITLFALGLAFNLDVTCSSTCSCICNHTFLWACTGICTCVYLPSARVPST